MQQSSSWQGIDLRSSAGRAPRLGLPADPARHWHSVVHLPAPTTVGSKYTVASSFAAAAAQQLGKASPLLRMVLAVPEYSASVATSASCSS
eukprot:8629499-Alexandrium_andersonii.AAC.1